MKLNFDTMSKAELRAYVIEHQDDREAFYAFVDRLTAKPSSVVYPASMTPEEIHKAVLDDIEKKRKSAEENYMARSHSLLRDSTQKRSHLVLSVVRQINVGLVK